MIKGPRLDVRKKNRRRTSKRDKEGANSLTGEIKKLKKKYKEKWLKKMEVLGRAHRLRD